MKSVFPALFGLVSGSELDAALGCGWSRCVDCQGGPCSPGNQQCTGSPPKYTFHLADPTCDINDPNGPFYDPVHGVYHNFYQIHLALDMNGAGDGPDWGHWVSRDFVKWARLPVAIWNDQYYDNSAIYTGSVTIVDGKPVLAYPGKCNGDLGCNDGKGGFTWVLAVPSNESDPLYTEWSKRGSISGKPILNPILNDTGDDPTTAWKTEHGEWRMLGNQECGGEWRGNPIYGSLDFTDWYKVGCTTLRAGECPSLFPLPKLTPGSEHYLPQHGALPSHVHKAGSGGFDQLQLGTWTDGLPGPEGTGTPGTWAPLAGSREVNLDIGAGYASKDFWDPVKQRRVLWLWGKVPSGIQTIPRELTYHPGLRQLVFAPVEEMRALRAGTIAELSTTPLAPGQPLTFRAGLASDTELEFALPTTATNITVAYQGGAARLEYLPAHAGGAPSAWVGLGSAASERLPLLADDETLTLRLFLDGVAGEVYFQGGRVVATMSIQATEELSIAASAGATLARAASYTMGSVYGSAEEVLATPRLTADESVAV